MVTSQAPTGFLDAVDASSCIHCGLCLSSCPTYLETGNENQSPRGRIHLMRALDQGSATLDESTARHLDLCLGCRACEAACPSGVPYGRLIEQTREHMDQHFRRGFLERFLRRVVIEGIFPYPELTWLAMLPGRWIRRAEAEHLLPGWARSLLELLPPEDTSPALPVRMPPPAGIRLRGRVGLLSGCVMSVMFRGTHWSTLRLLGRLGYEVVIPEAQGCCGALFAHSGRLEQARSAARRNIVAFDDVEAIVVNAAGCGSTLKEYGDLLRDDPVWATRAAAFSAKMLDLTEFLHRHAPAPSGATAVEPREGVAVHDACHLAHAQRVTRPPRELVGSVPGVQLVELAESDVCCGSAGSYNLTEPEMAARLQQRKIRNIAGSGAKTIVTTNPGCLLQIQAGLRESGVKGVEAQHIADFLDARGWGASRES